jgi:hypothetical protein
MFFYDALMSSEVLQTIAGLYEEPFTFKGILHGFAIKMWGAYSALVLCDTGEVVELSGSITQKINSED